MKIIVNRGNYFLKFLAIFVLTINFTLAQNTSDDITFDKTIELMESQLKLEVLQKLYERGFHIPVKVHQYYMQEQQAILDDLMQASMSDIYNMDRWIEAEKKVEKEQDLEMQELIESTGKTLLKEGCKVQESVRLFEMAVNKRKTGQKIDSILRGKILTNLLQNAQGNDKNSARCLKSIKSLYKGFIPERIRLDEGLKLLELERLKLFGSLRCVQDIIKSIDKIDMLKKSPSDLMQDKTDEIVTDYLKTLGSDIDEETVKKVSSSIKSIVEKSYGAISSWQEVNKDQLLPESVKRTARCFAVVGSGLSCVVGIMKEFDVLKWTGPLLDFFDFYAESMLLIPSIAQKMAATIDRVDQGYQGARLLNAFNNIPSKFELYSLTTFSKKLMMKSGLILPDAVDVLSNYTPIKIGYAEGSEDKARKFYFIVSKEIDSGLYVELSPGEFERLEQIVSDERIANAPDEARRGIKDYALSGVLSDKEASPVSEYASESYLDSLKSKARSTYFSEQELIQIYKGQKENAESMAGLREKKIVSLAVELAIRKATGSFEANDVYLWNNYIRALRESGLKLSPEQIIKLFNNYKSTPAAFSKFLKNKKDEVDKKNKGVPVFGMPSIQMLAKQPDSSMDVKPGTEQTLKSSIVVAGLAPMRKASAQIEWKLPWGNEQAVRSTVDISNGRLLLKQTIKIPKDAKPSEQTIFLDVKVINASNEPPVEQRTEGYFTVSGGEKNIPADEIDFMDKIPPVILATMNGSVTGITPKNENLPTHELRGKFELKDASGSFDMVLRFPNQINPGKPYSVAGDMSYSAFSTGVPLTVKMRVNTITNETTIPASNSSNGILSCAADYNFQVLGQKSYEWNAAYQRKIKKGTESGTGPNGLINYKIGSDKPSFDGIEQTGAGNVDQNGIPKFQSASLRFEYEVSVMRGDEEVLHLKATPEFDLKGGWFPRAVMPEYVRLTTVETIKNEDELNKDKPKDKLKEKPQRIPDTEKPLPPPVKDKTPEKPKTEPVVPKERTPDPSIQPPPKPIVKPPKDTGPATGNQAGMTAPDFSGDIKFRLSAQSGKVIVMAVQAMSDQWARAISLKLNDISNAPHKGRVLPILVFADVTGTNSNFDRLANLLKLKSNMLVKVEPAKFFSLYDIDTKSGISPQVLFIIDGSRVIRFRADNNSLQNIKSKKFIDTLTKLVPGVDWQNILNPQSNGKK